MYMHSPSTHWNKLPHGTGSSRGVRQQRGVVLVVALIMLVIISLLAALSVRNATSSESVSGSVRTTELATQAAEIALRYCEDAVLQIASGSVTLASVPTILSYVEPPQWKNMNNWDSASSTLTFVLPASAVTNGAAPTAYKRVPECMVEREPVFANGALSATSTYVITARGFGPEVPSGKGRPIGSEIWLQSTLELQ
jgi:type IV pilus assembly protein PilX